VKNRTRNLHQAKFAYGKIDC